MCGVGVGVSEVDIGELGGTGVAVGACSGLTDAGVVVADNGVDVEEWGSGVGGAAADGYSGVMVSPLET